MNAALQSLLGESVPDATTIDHFLESNQFPMVDGRNVTFVYRGEADEVRLQHFIYGLETSQPFAHVSGTDLWTLEIELPPRSHVQYKFAIIEGENHHWITDPLNPELARDPFGANSVCHSEGAERPEWTLYDSESRPGLLEEISIASTAFETQRNVKVYLPARFRRTRRYPLLVVHDGSDYLRYSDLGYVLDNLIHRLEVAPMIVALTDAGDRLVEYPDHARHAQFLTDELIPHMERDFPLAATPQTRGLMGASFGAVATLSTAWRNPGLFGRLLLQSGSFAFTDIGRHSRGPAFDPVVEFVNAFRKKPGRPSERVFVSCGTYESLIYENRSLVPLLQETGMEVRFVESRDGHTWGNWRDQLRTGLSWLFPGPLWMVYE